MKYLFLFILVFSLMNCASIKKLSKKDSILKKNSATSYKIQVAANDETFVINDEKFKAQFYCFDFEKDDSVIFLEGSPYGICVTAKIYNKNKRKSCEVWCE